MTFCKSERATDSLPASRRSITRDGVPTPMPILSSSVDLRGIMVNGELNSCLVFCTYLMASVSFMCFANSFATAASLVWKILRVLLDIQSPSEGLDGLTAFHHRWTYLVMSAARKPADVITNVCGAAFLCCSRETDCSVFALRPTCLRNCGRFCRQRCSFHPPVS